MSENEKDIPVKEMDDGSALVKVDLPEEVDLEEEDHKKKNRDNKNQTRDHHGGKAMI
jgi:hypothetical protein